MNETIIDKETISKTVLRNGIRGTLKVYLGMSAGVGKTFAMLNDAVPEFEQGIDVIAGYIEPHARPDTAKLAEKLPQLPLKIVEYKGLTLKEFDLESALLRKPNIILVDELAHTNAYGSRHTKRWQDIEELLSQGINVRTTVNIQHIESLKDVVSQITGIEVLETVPDSFLAKVDDFELVDIPPAELLGRLESGKIYAPEKVGTALTNFFRKEHLVALREIALRHTANAVDVQLRNLRSSDRNKSVWGTSPRVLVCVAPSKLALRLVRATARLANNLKAPMVVLAVETTRMLGANETDQRYMQKALGLAERLGGEIVRSAGDDIVGEVLKVARQKSASIIVVGKPKRKRFATFLFGSVADDLIRRSGDIDVHIVCGDKEEGSAIPLIGKSNAITIRSGLLTVISVAVTACLALLLSPLLDPANLGMLFVLPVAWTAFRYGRHESIIASVVGVLVFDFFFVPPQLSFSIADIQYLFTFAVMLVISTLVSSLSLRLKAQSAASSERERRTTFLLDLSRRLADCRSKEDIAIVIREILSDLFAAEVVLFWPQNDGSLTALNRTVIALENDPQERAVAEWVSSRKNNAGKGTETLPSVKGLYIALESAKEMAPVLAIYKNSEQLDPNDVDLAESFAHLAAGALNRNELQQEATTSQLKAQREELRNVLLSSVSHDLRTPLTTISGVASVIEAEPGISEKVRQLAATLSESAAYLTNIVRNVLDLTRLESGEIALKRDWQNLEEIIGVAFRRTEKILETRHVKMEIPKDFPLQFVDAILFEQVFVNLFENIARHTPPQTSVLINALQIGDSIKISVSDDGPGISSNKNIFEKLVKGNESPGLGLGLAVIKAIIEAHGGNISASNKVPHGAKFTITLPLGDVPPEVADE